jgi:regulatory protein
VGLKASTAVSFWDRGYVAGKITQLKYQKKNRNRVSVFLDGQFAFGVPAIVAARLKHGQFLSDVEIETLQNEGNVETAYSRVLDYLSYRPRSCAEVINYLQRRGVSENQIEAVTARLERAGFLDDEAFARFWVENRERFNPRGMRALRYELRNKGISDELIERATASLDFSASAFHSANKKARQLSHLDQQAFFRKLIEYLARRGFEYEVAREAAERHWAELTASE